MKLWQIIQWGNPKDGGDGPDTQCVVSAMHMKDAISKAKDHLHQHNQFPKKDWTDEVDMILLLGEDQRPNGDPILVIPVWVAHAFNMANSPSWHRASNGNWMTHAEKILEVNGKY